MLLKSWCAARSAAGVAAEVAAGVLPEGCWTFGAVKKLGVLALSKEVVLGLMGSICVL